MVRYFSVQHENRGDLEEGVLRDLFRWFFCDLVIPNFFLSLPPSNVQAVALLLAQCLAVLTLIFEAPIAIWAMVADDVPAGDIPFFDHFC